MFWNNQSTYFSREVFNELVMIQSTLYVTLTRAQRRTDKNHRPFDTRTVVRQDRKTQTILLLYRLICAPQIKARDHAPFLLFVAEMRHCDNINK